MSDAPFTRHTVATPRHRTSYLVAGPADGPLMIFLHGWPELGLLWRAQLAHFAAAGWRCIAPDMRGYGGSSVPTRTSDYALRELVADMAELHDALGGAPAVWVGHDWGSPVAWALVAHHPERCRGVASLCVPYHPLGFTMEAVLPLVDRELYPAETHPAGQWDYCLHYRENFHAAAREFEADTGATLAVLYRRATDRAVKKRASTAEVRLRGGWFGAAHRAPAVPRDETMMSQADFDALVSAFETTGFSGADSWYVNEAANLVYAGEAKDFGRLTLPVLFLHAAWDPVCHTVGTRLPEAMRVACSDLTEATIEGGHMLMLERPAEVSAAIGAWLAAKGLG